MQIWFIRFQIGLVWEVMGGNDLMDKFTFHPLPKNMLCNDLANKVFP